VEQVPERERDEVQDFFARLGLSQEVQEQAVAEMTKDKDKWVDFMMKYELGLDKPDPQRATKSAFNIGASYVVGGLIPLSPYFFVSEAITGLKISVVITLICLFIFGYFKSKMTGVHPIAGAVRVMIIGALAAGCAFAVAKLIQA
jgi:VIT1/CCC1 family predicted Fe2+/Mn2+ transporter